MASKTQQIVIVILIRACTKHFQLQWKTEDPWDMFAWEKTVVFLPGQDKSTPVFGSYGVKQVWQGVYMRLFGIKSNLDRFYFFHILQQEFHSTVW